MPNKIDLTGQRFGRLTVVKESGKVKNGSILWECICDCEKVKVISSNSLRTGNTSSCGCSLAEKNSARFTAMNLSRTKDSSPLTKLYGRYKSGAKFRKIHFELSLEQFNTLVTSNCHYCGREPLQIVTSKGGIPMRYNGIDRKNPSTGYTNNNVLPCCSICNYMKLDFTYDEFICQCKIIANRFKDYIDMEEVS